VAAPATDNPHAGQMEKNMSKSNDSSKLGPATQVRELRDDELENVSGGQIKFDCWVHEQYKTGAAEGFGN
jgi:hypothetical protein